MNKKGAGDVKGIVIGLIIFLTIISSSILMFTNIAGSYNYDVSDDFSELETKTNEYIDSSFDGFQTE